MRRRLLVRLDDGTVESGESVEWVCTMGAWINPVYRIERIA